MDRRWIHGALFTPQYICGVRSFMNFVRERFTEAEKILCPCQQCMNNQSLQQNEVERHLLLNGMSSTYTRWIDHGEDSNIHVLEQLAVVEDANVDSSVPEHTNDCGLDGMLGELIRSEQHGNEARPEDGNENVASQFKQLIEDAKRELYPGCMNFSRFTFVIKMLHVKSYHRITNSAFSAIMKILSEAFPQFNTIPKSYDEAKKMLRELGLGYESIHVCPNNCVLFRKTYVELDSCPVCEASRWKDPERKKVPAKVLRHFPLVPRLQRLFVSKKRSKEAQWHKLKRKYNEKEMTHPADGMAWEDFDNQWPDFAEDARNIRLGLATDGFNPFSNMSSSYSMWPVFVIPYNLPPWPCILCKLEKIFPPAFFDVMVHLAVHLPDEAILRGPVQFGWMYPIERRLYTLKRSVRNKARPEGSIAEAYVANEALTFCSRYMDDVETRFNRLPRNVGFSDQSAYTVDIFGHGVNLIGACDLSYSEELDKLAWYVLHNCDQAEKYMKMFEDELRASGVHAADLERRTEHGFWSWFRNYMWRLNASEEVDDDIFALACGPDIRVASYSTCVVNGVRYCTVERDKNKKTQNSGVACSSSYRNEMIDFYGILKEIIELEYNAKDDGTKRTVVLFRCDWYKLDGKHTAVRDDGFCKSINIGSLWYKKDCFILATQATQVFYLPDIKNGTNWRIVQTFKHRHLYNVSEKDGVVSTAAPYQEQTCAVDIGRRPEVSEILPDMPLNRVDEAGLLVDAAEVARLRKENESKTTSEDEEGDEVEDDTLMEYLSEEEAAPVEVDSDDE